MRNYNNVFWTKILMIMAIMIFAGVNVLRAQDGWEVKTFEEAGITIEIPFDLEKADLPLPDDVKKYILEMQTYNHDDEEVSLFLNHIRYNDDVAANVDGAAEGAINNMKITEGIADFSSKISKTTCSSKSARIIEGSLILNGRKAGFMGIIITDGAHLWQVLTNFFSGEKNEKMAERIINSVIIGNNNNQNR